MWGNKLREKICNEVKLIADITRFSHIHTDYVERVERAFSISHQTHFGDKKIYAETLPKRNEKGISDLLAYK